ncbi:hypothetical protein SLEP1_g52337 [Rubroshorea leprosula]|uniref:Uncharacterized protein n=1 Tax=Rubroshorea leprosula TaxID=152421 RepID=A0AAV5M5Z4_9ROSI|nr:hypothetical protein SLEP1_g52337 [Rubroshorea leprosula]
MVGGLMEEVMVMEEIVVKKISMAKAMKETELHQALLYLTMDSFADHALRLNVFVTKLNWCLSPAANRDQSLATMTDDFFCLRNSSITYGTEMEQVQVFPCYDTWISIGLFSDIYNRTIKRIAWLKAGEIVFIMMAI